MHQPTNFTMWEGGVRFKPISIGKYQYAVWAMNPRDRPDFNRPINPPVAMLRITPTRSIFNIMLKPKMAIEISA